MTLLLDTNIFLEVLLDQPRADEARRLLDGEAGEHVLMLSDFSLHSLGVLLFRKQRAEVFQAFVADLLGAAGWARSAPRASRRRWRPTRWSIEKRTC